MFHTSNSEFIQKCGLDAYFFLRYMRTLLKIFIPLAFIILPILLPMNGVHGRGSHFATGIYDKPQWSNITGLDTLGWGNVRPTKTHRYWAHLVLAVVVVVYSCFVFFDELRGYIRLRQAYLTSPQHRLRASATTVLVSAIPQKWCTFEALNGLYDVFPGGIRNIWINRNFDELNEKVKRRDKIARKLESAETNLVRNAKKAHLKQLKKEEKRLGKSAKGNLSNVEMSDDKGKAMADSGGISSGNPHQVRHTVDEALDNPNNEPSREPSPVGGKKKPLVPIPLVGEGFEAVGHGIGTIGQTVFGGLKKIGKGVDDRLETTGGFIPETSDSELRGSPLNAIHRGDYDGATDASAINDEDFRHAPSQDSRRPVLRKESDETIVSTNARKGE